MGEHVGDAREREREREIQRERERERESLLGNDVHSISVGDASSDKRHTTLCCQFCNIMLYTNASFSQHTLTISHQTHARTFSH